MDVPLGIGLEEWPYPWPVRFFETDPAVLGARARMAYMDVAAARGHAPVAVLLHGKNFDSSYWKSTIVYLHQAGYRVVVPDQVGFNKSAKPDVEYTFDGLARCTVDLLASPRDELLVGTRMRIALSGEYDRFVRAAARGPIR